MGTLRLLGEPTPVELSFKIKMSDELVERYIDENGERPTPEWEIDFNLKDVDDPNLRRRLREAYRRYDKAKFYPVLSRISEQPADFLEDLEPWLDQIEAKEAEASQKETDKEEAEKAAAEAFRQGMKEWVAENGSRPLKLAIEGDYRSNTSYALERSQQELPGFWVDTAEDCVWEERVDPSEEALILEEGVRESLQAIDSSLGVRIVWLTETPRALDQKIEAENLEFEPGEALIVEGYLGRYLLVMPMDPKLRRDSEGGA